MDGISIAREADAARVALRGKPDGEALRACAEGLDRELGSGLRHVEFDLGAAPGLDSAWAALMVRAAAAIRRTGGSLRVRAAGESVAGALRVLGLEIAAAEAR